jgi:hypothetical protein
MTFDDFQKSLSLPAPPPDLSAYLYALWFDGTGNWNKAHETIQDIDDKTAAWIHAYLHRKEGDPGNAGYWYRKAGKEIPSVSLNEEWGKIVLTLL